MGRPPGPQGRHRAVWATSLLVGLAFVFGLVPAVAAAQTPPPPTLVERGGGLFGRHCATCHGAEGRGSRLAPSIQSAPPALIDFVIRTGRMPLPAVDAASVRRAPALNQRQRLAIVAYMETIGPNEPDIPTVEPLSGDLSHGREVYEANCVACHSPHAVGIAVSEQDIAPGLYAADPVEIAEAVLTGPGVMPVFGHLSEHDVDSLVRYILFLRDRPTPGGIAVGRSGPVTEGFVAWVFGLVVLLVAAYFIGERRVD